MDSTYKTLVLVALFGLLFATIGWIAPAMYASHAPQEQYIEVHDFEASNATTADSEHIICINRTVHEPNSVTIFSELHLVDEDGDIYEVDAQTSERYFQGGQRDIKIPYKLPDDLEAGTYHYIHIVEMDLVENRVTREFKFTSETFTITESNETSTTSYTEYEC